MFLKSSKAGLWNHRLGLKECHRLHAGAVTGLSLRWEGHVPVPRARKRPPCGGSGALG